MAVGVCACAFHFFFFYVQCIISFLNKVVRCSSQIFWLLTVSHTNFNLPAVLARVQKQLSFILPVTFSQRLMPTKFLSWLSLICQLLLTPLTTPFSDSVECLEQKIGVSGLALSWFELYLSNRLQFVPASGSNSKLSRLDCVVPQGSVVGPIPFVLYVKPLLRSYANTLVSTSSFLMTLNRANHVVQNIMMTPGALPEPACI